MKWLEWVGYVCLGVLILLAAQGCGPSEVPVTLESRMEYQKRQSKFWLTPEEVAAKHYKCKKLGLGTSYMVEGPGITHVWCVPE